MQFDPEKFEESGRRVRSFMDARKQREYRAAIGQRCTEIADQVVPEFRATPTGRGFQSHKATKWQAAWDAACIALGGDPAEYRG